MRGGNADPSVCSACRGRRLQGTAQHQPVATSPPSVPSQLQQTTGKNANYSLVPSAGGKAGGARTRKEMGAGAERRAGRRELKPSAGTPGSILCCGETPGSRERVGRGSGEGPRLQVGTGVGNRRRTIPRVLGVCAPGGQGSAGIGSSVPASRAGAGRSRSRRSGRTFFQGWAKPGCWEAADCQGICGSSHRRALGSHLQPQGSSRQFPVSRTLSH